MQPCSQICGGEGTKLTQKSLKTHIVHNTLLTTLFKLGHNISRVREGPGCLLNRDRVEGTADDELRVDVVQAAAEGAAHLVPCVVETCVVRPQMVRPTLNHNTETDAIVSAVSYGPG